MFGVAGLIDLPPAGEVLLRRLVPVASTLRYASRGFVTAPADAPALTPVSGRAVPSTISRRLATADDGTFSPTVETTIGTVALDNTDHALDAVLGANVLEGNEIRISLATAKPTPSQPSTPVSGLTWTNGSQPVTWNTTFTLGWPGRPPEPALTDFGLVFRGTVASYSAGRGQVTLSVQPDTARLRNPVSQGYYGGNGGQDGDAALAGRAMPVCLGFCRNVEPAAVDRFLLIFQVHHRAILDIPAVYDRMDPLERALDVDTYDALAALVVSDPTADPPIAGDLDPGQYAVCLATGHFRLGGAPTGRVTADVYGDGAVRATVEPFSDGSFFSDGTGFTTGRSGREWAGEAQAVVERLLSDYAAFPATSVDSDQMLNGRGVVQSYVGLYLPPGDTTAIADAVSTVAASVNAVVPQDRRGVFRLVHLTPPGDTGVVTLGPGVIDLDGLEILDLPYQQPPSTWRVAYDRNWTVMSDTDISAAADDGTRAFALRQSSYAVVSDPALSALYPAAKVGQLEAILADKADAAAVAAERIVFYGRGKRMYQAPCEGIIGQVDLTEVVRVQVPRYGLDTGKGFVAMAVDEDVAGRRTTLVLFG